MNKDFGVLHKISTYNPNFYEVLLFHMINVGSCILQ
jgi:hypothetical protein